MIDGGIATATDEAFEKAGLYESVIEKAQALYDIERARVNNAETPKPDGGSSLSGQLNNAACGEATATEDAAATTDCDHEQPVVKPLTPGM